MKQFYIFTAVALCANFFYPEPPANRLAHKPAPAIDKPVQIDLATVHVPALTPNLAQQLAR